MDKTELEEYQEFVGSCPQPNEEGLKKAIYLKSWWAATQMTCEAAEVLTIFEKAIRKNRVIDLTHLEEELGDVIWGIACICEDAGIDLDNVITTNISKLRKRHELA